MQTEIADPGMMGVSMREERMIERGFADGEYIYRAGEAADGVYRVRSGNVRLELRDASGGALRLTLHAGEIFGETGFLLGDPRPGDAVAAGDTTVDFLTRNALLALMTSHPDMVAPLLGRMFAAAEAEIRPEPVERSPAVPAPEPVSGGNGARIRLIPDGKRIRDLVGAEEILIERLPYFVGRTANGEGSATYRDIALALDDRRPFNLSRRHFAIEDEAGTVIVRDFGSYHGTTVNGLTLGGEGRPKSVALRMGETALVAGKADSPFRFRIVVE